MEAVTGMTPKEVALGCYGLSHAYNTSGTYAHPSVGKLLSALTRHLQGVQFTAQGVSLALYGARDLPPSHELEVYLDEVARQIPGAVDGSLRHTARSLHGLHAHESSPSTRAVLRAIGA
eukprot:Hpha_TRINITY_DN7709_c0_g1::TRINITY_DN7709_c0_g1_i1::g.85503::m.85503